MLVVILQLVLSDGQGGEAWALSDMGEQWTEK
jgi:hypothetical protein